MMKKRFIYKDVLYTIIFTFTMLIGLSACNDDNEVIEAKDKTQEITEEGGIISIDNPNSPIYGAKIEIEGDTLVDPTETISISYKDELPAPLNDDAIRLGAKQITKVISLKRTGIHDFGKAVKVTVPFDKTAVPANVMPIVLFYDETSKNYSAVPVSDIDREKGLLTFRTAHFSDFVGVSFSQIASYDVGFNPAGEGDGFFIHNFGTYDEPGGNSFAMAAYAAWYHAAKKSENGNPLAKLYREGDPQLEEDDQTVRELISYAQILSNQKAHMQALQYAKQLSGNSRINNDLQTGQTLIYQLIATKQAQVLVLGAKNNTTARAVTVYAYDANAQRFKFYDPEFPSEVMTITWNATNGFGTDSKGQQWEAFGFASFNQAYSPATLERLYAGAQSGWPASHFPEIVLTSPTPMTSNADIYEVGSDSNITISGSVPRAKGAEKPNAQRYLHVYLNGIKHGNGFIVDNNKNTFSISVSHLPTPSGTDVILMVSENDKSWAGGFNSYKQFKLRVAGQHFITNLGFETGDFSNWESERHLWPGRGSGTANPSDKSAIVTTGFDPIATDLPTTLYGNYAARINNSDNRYHISTLTQQAIVPQGANPMLRFHWAAVLEDPQHAPEDQPYVTVSVINITKGSVIYQRHFYSNDPNYSGWKSYQGGDWKSIPWQLVELPMVSHIGDTIEIKVEGADCNLGAHGGYVYLDAEE